MIQWLIDRFVESLALGCCQNFGVEEDLGLKLETMIPWSASLMNFVGCAFIEEAEGHSCGCDAEALLVMMLCLEEHGVAATCVGVRRTGAAFGDPRVEDPGVEGREGVSGVCELTLTQGTERATCGGRAAPLY